MRNPLMVGARVYLRAAEVDDAEAVAAMRAAESETFMGRGRMPVSPLFYAQKIAAEYAQQPPTAMTLTVCLTADDRCIGVVGLTRIDWVHRTAETFSQIGPAIFRGQGYGTEAKHLLLAYCFDHLHLYAVHSAVFETNTRSMAALAKQGYQPAGRLQWHNIKDGLYRDLVYFDVTRDEWLAAYTAWQAQRRTP